MPVIAAVIILIGAIGVTFFPLQVVFREYCAEQLADYLGGFIGQMTVSLLLILFLKKLHLLKIAGFTTYVSKWWFAWPMVLYIALNASDAIAGNIVIDGTKQWTVLMFVLVYLSTGVFEETLCRGVVLTLFMRKWGGSKKGYYLALILSSVLFGLIHFIHFVLGDASLLATMTQVVCATFIGVFFGGCLLINQNILPVILLHGVFNIAGSLNEIAINDGIHQAYRTISVNEAVVNILIMLPLMIYGLCLASRGYQSQESRGDDML